MHDVRPLGGALLLVAMLNAPATAASVPLFARGLDGWTAENARPGSFSIAGEVLKVEGPNGWLRSRDRYGDFRLSLQFRFLTEDADSGLFLRAAGDGSFVRGWPNGSYQVQLRNPALESRFPPVGGLLRHGLPGAETRFDPAEAKRLSKPAGEWQALEVHALGERLTVRLNGAVVTEAAGLAERPGYIGVQAEAGALEFRAVRIEEL